MPPVKPSVLLVLSLLFTFPAAAQFCDLQLRYENGQVRWKALPGAKRYTVLETYGDLKAPVYYSTRNTYVDVSRRATAEVRVRYIVTAELDDTVRITAEWSDACTGSIDVTLTPDPNFARLTRRAVFPVVGSTPGAFGGQFRTALELRGSAAEKGRIVFHPAGRIASDDDPSIPYAFTDSRVLSFDDIVARLGQSGIGSLEIIPDPDSLDRVPHAQIRLYNETSIGTFGTYGNPVLPFDYLRPAGFQVSVPDARFRLNMGIRTYTPTRVQIIFQRADGRLDGLKELSFPAGWMEMKPAAEFTGKALEAGHVMSVAIVEGTAVPFYTITENRTNDPTLIVPPANGISREVGEFVD